MQYLLGAPCGWLPPITREESFSVKDLDVGAELSSCQVYTAPKLAQLFLFIELVIMHTIKML